MHAPMAASPRGRFVVLDGVDGCGKSSQATRLVARLLAQGHTTVHLREPGGTPLGEALRELLLAGSFEIGAASEVLLFAAARRALLDQTVEPALASGQTVVCERFSASTFAYQAYAGGADEQAVLGLLQQWAGAPAPDAYVILDLDVEQARARRGADRDRIEAKGLEFQRRVRAGYLRYARLDPKARVVDARENATQVEARVWQELQHVFG